MAREKFDNGLTNPAGTPYTLDAPDRWGGNSGTYVNTDGEGGTVSKQQISNPVTSDVNRYRGMGAASAGRQAYQLQFGDADADNAQANDAGKLQGDANDVLAKQADGQDNITSNFQQGMLQRGSDNQTAGALSSAGGALAQMSALQHANAQRAGYMQRGGAEIAAQRANDMASGRAALAQGTAAARKGDLTGQYLNDQQAQMQASSEASQRALNQSDQMHDEGMAVDTEAQGLQANQHAAADAKAREQAQYNKSQADQNRAVGYLNTGVAAVGNAVAPGVGTVAAQGGNAAVSTDQSTDPNNPANNPDPTSDGRAKEKLSPNALTQLMAKAKGMQSALDAQRSQIQSSVGKNEIPSSGDELEGGQSLRKEPNQSKRPLLLETGQESRMLPSDEILENWRLAHQDPEKDQHAPPPSAQRQEKVPGYDRSAFARGDDGTAPGDADTLAAGIEQAHAKDAGTAGALPETRGTLAQQKQGYYASRRGQVGSVTGEGPAASYDLGFGKGSNYDRGMAPGTGDAITHGGMDYGGHKDASWGFGPHGAAPEYRGGKLGKDGFTEASKMDPYSEAVSTSDKRAKEHAELEQPEKEDRNPLHQHGVEISGPAGPSKPEPYRRAAVSEPEPPPETPEQRTARFAEKAGVIKREPYKEPGVWDKLRSGIASVSDERAKNKGYALNKGAGGGEEEHDGTTREHRGPSIVEAPPAKSNPLIEMQKHANRMLVGQPYKYKEGFGEDTSQVHHGFMAQNLEQNPITATAVREDGTGLKKVNNVDALRVTASGVASLQEQHDALEAAVAELAGRRKKRIA
jgi:hypothetical protein